MLNSRLLDPMIQNRKVELSLEGLNLLPATGISTVLMWECATRGKISSACAAVPVAELPSSPPKIMNGRPPTINCAEP